MTLTLTPTFQPAITSGIGTFTHLGISGVHTAAGGWEQELYYLHRKAVLTEISIPSHPLLAFEHLSLYIQKHLSQSVAVCGSLW